VRTEPVDAHAWWTHVAMRAIPGVEGLDLGDGAGRSWRVIRRLVPGGPGAGPGLVRAEVHVPVTGPGEAAPLVVGVPDAGGGAVRCWIGLDVAREVEAARAALADDAVLGPMLAAHPALPVPGTPDGAELALRTVLGQQVSVAAARTFAGRLAVLVAAGEVSPGEVSPGTALLPFPSAGAIAAAGPEALRGVGLTGARAATLHALATALSDGLRIAPSADHAAVRAGLLALPGIGPWTAEYVALRALRDLDAFPASDLVLRRAMGVETPAQALRLAERWRPWRGVAAQHLWTSVSAP
jgi:3-methyladenine DNA glycosylase/8-oxoguanine DNA glycosylase